MLFPVEEIIQREMWDASLYFDIYETAFTSMIDNIGKRPIFRLITPPFDQGKNVDTHCFLLL